MYNRWKENSSFIINEAREFYRLQEKSSHRSLDKIVQASQLLTHSIMLYEAYGNMAGNMAIKIVKELPEIVEQVKNENEKEFQSTLDRLSKEDKESCLAYSFYRSQFFITGHTMETLGRYHLKAIKCVASPLKNTLKDIHKDGSLYFILPSILKYLKCIYGEDYRGLKNLISEYDRNRNKSRGNNNSN